MNSHATTIFRRNQICPYFFPEQERRGEEKTTASRMRRGEGGPWIEQIKSSDDMSFLPYARMSGNREPGREEEEETPHVVGHTACGVPPRRSGRGRQQQQAEGGREGGSAEVVVGKEEERERKEKLLFGRIFINYLFCQTLGWLVALLIRLASLSLFQMALRLDQSSPVFLPNLERCCRVAELVLLPLLIPFSSELLVSNGTLPRMIEGARTQRSLGPISPPPSKPL